MCLTGQQSCCQEIFILTFFFSSGWYQFMYENLKLWYLKSLLNQSSPCMIQVCFSHSFLLHFCFFLSVNSCSWCLYQAVAVLMASKGWNPGYLVKLDLLTVIGIMPGFDWQQQGLDFNLEVLWGKTSVTQKPGEIVIIFLRLHKIIFTTLIYKSTSQQAMFLQKGGKETSKADEELFLKCNK